MEASWNQKYNLYLWAGEHQMPKVQQLLEEVKIWQKPMSLSRYKQLRKAILFGHQPATALKLLAPYKEDL